MIYKIYCDLDGVLADLYGYFRIFTGLSGTAADTEFRVVFWQHIKRHYEMHGQVFRRLPLMHDARELWDAIAPLGAEILSSHGSVIDSVEDEKRAWVAEHLGPEVKVNLVAKSELKAAYATPNAVLIDDYKDVIEGFRAAGGIGILHRDARSTLAALAELGLPVGAGIAREGLRA